MLSQELKDEINRILKLAGFDGLTQPEIDKLNSLNLELTGSITCQALNIINKYILPWRNITCSGNAYEYLNSLSKENNCQNVGEIKPDSSNTVWAVGFETSRRHC